ncbi:hypothetical protein PUR71_22480 [Streptomyces sp. SP17BM10]|uniref:WapI family immunity protein n=1 Tax=Streptomyces sp. SP17BM10 TaxID=3002530 RepID=UPI002E7A6D88|nr:hypothetical protein [Streptomyces sp. SP17BM10]MEE1785650.1 hypothetical protein [Streptomyces sp. SP17BM10]
MLLEDSPHRLDLRPRSYQFGTARGESFDDNWLVIVGAAAAPQGSWRFVEACLTTWEARRISRWLRAAADPARSPGALAFTEPLLAFGLAEEQPTDGRRLVRVRFALEAAPPWVDLDAEDEDEDEDGDGDGDADDEWPGYTAEFLLSPSELRAAADTWDAELAPFPER